MPYKIPQGRLNPKKEGTFGKAKKPYKGKNKNRTGDKKESYLSHGRISAKVSSKNKSGATTYEKEYLSYLKTLDAVCFACGKQNGIEWHHVKRYSSDKKDHTSLIPLCGIECHRIGTVLSAHGTPLKWRCTFSLESQQEAAKVFYDEFVAQKL